MRKIVPLFILIFAFTVLTSFNLQNSNDLIIKQQISQMTLREKVGQLFVIRPDSLNKDLSSKEINNMYSKKAVTSVDKNIIEYFQKYPVGGFVLFGKNILSPEQLKDFNYDLHHLGKYYPLIYVDEEGGNVVRLANKQNFDLPQYSCMQDIGDSKNIFEAFKVGETIGNYLKEYGIDVDFAPVADVNTNKLNPIIGKRSFSSEPELAGKMATSMLKGLKSKKIYGCFKHFPGHGGTSTDTHKGYTEVLKDWDELQKCELIPFEIGIEDDVPFIMTSHISLPNITGDTNPTTLSYEMVTRKLRGELKYKGIVISDAMSMGAIKDKFSDEEAAVEAILSGVDIILMPYNLENAFEGVIKAVENNVITEERINESLYRILTLKLEMQNW